MATAADIKKDLDFYRGLSALLGTLKLLAAAQYQTLLKRMKTYTEYLDCLGAMFSWLDMQTVTHPLLSGSDATPCVVALTTDAGMLGGLNALVMKKALHHLKQEQARLVIVGKRGVPYVEDRTLLQSTFPGVTDEGRLAQALRLRDYLISHVLRGQIGRVWIVYPKPVSFTVQSIEVEQLIPVSPPVSGDGERPQDILFESSPPVLAEYLIYLWLGQKLYEVFGFSRLAEQGARYMHLESCTQRLAEQDKQLKFKYFRAKHEIVDQNLRELFAARTIHAS